MAYQPNRQVSPKNYIVVGGSSQIVRETSPGHDAYDRDRVSGALDLEIEVGPDGLHAGVGLFMVSGKGSLYKQFSAMNRIPSIPGTGIKGPIRMIAESLTGSCAQDRDDGCFYREAGAKLCFGCRVFGALGFRGCLGFDEALLIEEDKDLTGLLKLPIAFKPGGNQRGRRFYGPRVDSSQEKLRYAILTEGARLDTRMSFDQVAKKDLAIVMLAMGLDGSFMPKLGGGKFAGLGGVTFRATQLSLRSAADYQSLDATPLTGEDLETWVKDQIKLAISSLSQDGTRALQQLRNHLK